MPKAVAIYARISSDRDDDQLGVTRQLQDCRRLAAARGWEVAEEYVDNNVSAYSSARRPAYRRMLDDITAGLRDAVIVYNADRLLRKPSELEDLIKIAATAGIKHLASVTGDVDLSNEDGRLMARVLIAFAAKESDAKSLRQLASSKEADDPTATSRTAGRSGRPRPLSSSRLLTGSSPARVSVPSAPTSMIEASFRQLPSAGR
jgi:DNA invertase Pin-like site-specific DNA recombinase